MNVTAATRRLAVASLLTWCLVLNSFGVAAADPGDLDPTFGGDGTVITVIPGGSWANGVAVQSDGKVLVATFAGGVGADFVVVRYQPDGTLDQSFGDGGIVYTDFGDSTDIGRAIAVGPDGTIVVGGYTDSDVEPYRFAFARYDSDGALDPTFGGDGRVSTDIGGANFYAMAVDADGRVVGVGGGTDFAVVRYTEDGVLDSTFSGDGKLTTDFNNSFDTAYSVALQADDRIVVAGYASLSGAPADAALARYNPDGTLDTSFAGGKVTLDYHGRGDYAQSVAIQPDGHIVVAGSTESTEVDALVGRLTPTGVLDPTFSRDGWQTIHHPSGTTYATGVAIQADGRIVLAGASSRDSHEDFLVARLDQDGHRDGTFSVNGLQRTDFGRSSDSAFGGVAIQADGRIVVAGSALPPGGIAIARYLGS